jgi:hypothetical protein
MADFFPAKQKISKERRFEKLQGSGLVKNLSQQQKLASD